MKLHLGFEDVSYRSQSGAPRRRGPRRGTPYGQGKRTLEVANELEEKYKIVETFWDLEQDDFVEMLEEAFADELEEVMAMEQPSRKRTAISDKYTDKLEQKFRNNLSSRRYDGVIPGTPTTAAQRGVSHLEQHPYAKRGPRPSFVDTGMYQQSFRVWIDEVED